MSITIVQPDVAAISYSSATYCQNELNPSSTVTGTTGGTFSSTAGLSIDMVTGQIDLSTSTPGIYTVDYQTTGTCSVSTSTSVTITAIEDASYSYGSTLYCQDGVDPIATISGTSGGTFSSTTGLSINASTGEVDLSVSTPGTYAIDYTTTGICFASSEVSITITQLDGATISYSSATYCQGGIDPAASITGVNGGTFSSTTGLTINSSTGEIDLNTSTQGVYTIEYLTDGQCPIITSASVTINTLDDATFNYASGTICLTGSDQTPSITGINWRGIYRNKRTFN